MLLYEYEEKYKNDLSRVQQQLKREQFVIPEGANFYNIFAQREKSDSIGELINDALVQIEEKNLAKLEEYFGMLILTRNLT